MVERQPSKLNVAGSNPVSRSPRPRDRSGNEANGKQTQRHSAHLAQSVEHFLGKEEVVGSNPMVGST